MGDTTQIQITPENAEEFLETALSEEKAAAGSDEQKVEEATDEQQEQTTDEQQDAKTEDGERELEIGQKKDEEQSEKDGDDSDESFSLEAAYTEWQENGALTPETNDEIVSRLEKAGFDNAQGIIDQYLAGANASVQAVRSTAFEAAGGEGQYGEMIDWARENLSPAQIAAYDQSVSDPNMVELAVRGLRAQYEAAGGTTKQQPAKRVDAGAKPDGDFSGQVPLPRSNYQVSELVSDARYAKDPGYRAEVDARIKQAIERGLI